MGLFIEATLGNATTVLRLSMIFTVSEYSYYHI